MPNAVSAAYFLQISLRHTSSNYISCTYSVEWQDYCERWFEKDVKEAVVAHLKVWKICGFVTSELRNAGPRFCSTSKNRSSNPQFTQCSTILARRHAEIRVECDMNRSIVCGTSVTAFRIACLTFSLKTKYYNFRQRNYTDV